MTKSINEPYATTEVPAGIPPENINDLFPPAPAPAQAAPEEVEEPVDPSDPDELEDEIDQAEAEGDVVRSHKSKSKRK